MRDQRHAIKGMKQLRLFATTPIGVEDIAAWEVKTLIGGEPAPKVGRVGFTGSLKDVYALNLKARTLHKIYIQLARAGFESLSDLYSIARSLDYAWIIDAAQSFAVRSERIGVHSFTSLDVSRTIGQAVIDAYMHSTGRRLKVNLDAPDVEIFCLVRDQEFQMGVNTTGESLHKRGYRVYAHPAALKPTLAAAMLRLAGWTFSQPLLDPMCGGATIPIEAALLARNAPPARFRTHFAFMKLKIFNPDEYARVKAEALAEMQPKATFPIYAMDKMQRHLMGGMRNAAEADVLDTITFKLGDAADPASYPETRIKHVVVNPPYGLRARPRENVAGLYEGFLKALKARSPGATLTLITAASKRFREAAEKTGIVILQSRRVRHGDLPAEILVCQT